MTKRVVMKNFTLIIGFFTLLILSSMLFAQETGPFIGTWGGSLSAAGQVVEFTIEFSLDENENIQGHIDFPAMGASGINLMAITVDGKRF